jgi:tetratricopeptide (TPR) repeat protein
LAGRPRGADAGREYGGERQGDADATMDPVRARTNQANVLRDLGPYDEAIAEYRDFLALYEATGVPPTFGASIMLGLADTQRARGSLDEAIATLEAALALNASGEDREFQRARIELALARALWSRKAERPRARKLAMASAEALRAAGPDAATVLKTVEAWRADPRAAAMTGIRRERDAQMPNVHCRPAPKVQLPKSSQLSWAQSRSSCITWSCSSAIQSPSCALQSATHCSTVLLSSQVFDLLQ